MDKEEFKTRIRLTVDAKILELSGNKKDKKYLTYNDACTVTHMVRNIFVTALDIVPNNVEAACLLSDAILAPTIKEKKELLKKAYGMSGLIMGIAMILYAIGTALGWGLGLIASMIAFFTGTSMLGPIATAASGAIILAITGYFVCSGDEEEVTEKYRKALESSLDAAIENIWDEYGEKLSNVKVNKNGSRS